ncbi:hypothetical protein [Reichenbachiella sp. MALMAid0571]|uniref:hypothetical protein n=1 Tax=Reichenbachiella sp. MALMAid0571 TaxID=3143939 RepID=UPI0032DE5BFF
MKVTSSLLRKYVAGLCTPQEAQEVESWMSSFEDDAVLSPEEIGNSPQIIRERLYGVLFGSGEKTPVIPLYKKLVKYVAAACIIFATFFGGRFSANTANANTIVDKSPKGHLYISGGKGTKGNLPGKVFKLQFDGTLRLYNSAMGQKSVQVGNTSFILESRQTYYLLGSIEKPNLINSDYLHINYDEFGSPKGDFSISRLDN